MKDDEAILYVDNSPSSTKAEKILKGAGVRYTVRVAPSAYRAAYRTPVLFGLFNKFEGIEGIQIFVDNSRLLSHSMQIAKPRRRK
ncbi:MAG TPA: hypothetical protein VGO56_00340 [Pyrinomonadaceae bacterium]|jgi:hypothetical protein|nr:hypothetical protein [Pyrinomonadaceae bacterium]